VPARIGKDGAVPLPQPRLAPHLLGLVQHVAAYERLAASAAANGDLQTARLAMMANPLVREYRLTESLAARMLTTETAPSLARTGEGG
jgi:6-phospho-beta-glucosidase